MQTSYSPSPHNRVDYFPLPNGYADVFLHRNEIIETDEEGNKQYVAEEMYFQIDESITKEQIEQNFEYMWQDAERQVPKMSTMGIMKTLELEEPTFWDYIKGYLTTAFSTTSGKVQVVDENEDVKGAGYYHGILNSLIDIKDSIDISTGKLTRMVGYNENVVSGTVINYSDMADGGQFIAYNADGTQYVGIKGDALAVDASKLTYQLAEPIVTKIEPQVLTAKAGDTIMWIPDGNPEDSTIPELEVEYVVDMGGTVNKLVDTAQLLNERAGMHSDNISELQIKADTHESDYIKHPIVGTTKGSSTEYTLSPDPPLDELVIGVGAIMTAHLASGDNPTLNISGKGAKPIIKPNENPAKLLENGVYHVRYNGVNFILLGEGGEYGTAQINHVLAPYTIGTEEGIVEGTMPDHGSKTFTPSDITQNGASGYYSGITVNPRPVLSGDAVVADVRSGKTFYKDSYTKLTGTIPNNTAMNSTITTQGGQIVVPQGYHPDGGIVKANFANLIASNVKKGVNIGGVVGTHEGIVLKPPIVIDSSVKRYFDYSTKYFSGSTWKKCFECQILYSGTVVVEFSIRSDSGDYPEVWGRVYKNGTPVGTNRVVQDTGFTAFRESVDVNAGDKLSVYCRGYSGSDGGDVRNFTIWYDVEMQEPLKIL